MKLNVVNSSKTRIKLMCLFFCLCAIFLSDFVQAAQFDIAGPVGSSFFGNSVTALPNGNFVVTDLGFDLPGRVSNVGAVFLYSPTRSLIST